MNSAERGVVIFDLDGVLVDTQDAENSALAYLGSLMGLAIDQEQQHELFSGKRMQQSIGIIEEMAQRPAPDGAVALVRAKCEELIGDRIDPIDGVVETLEWLSARPVELCVASNSPLDIIERRLTAAGVQHYFSGRLFSAYQANAWKPDPALFRWAAGSCGAAADDCVVIEDSVVGVDSALAAGMRVLQYDPAPGSGPHRTGVEVFGSIRDLPEILNASHQTGAT
jgi:HAD superfamily hydrolase (TIGR01509 family)